MHKIVKGVALVAATSVTLGLAVADANAGPRGTKTISSKAATPSTKMGTNYSAKPGRIGAAMTKAHLKPNPPRRVIHGATLDVYIRKGETRKHAALRTVASYYGKGEHGSPTFPMPDQVYREYRDSALVILTLGGAVVYHYLRMHHGAPVYKAPAPRW